MPEKLYLNGNYTAVKKAKISVFDRGFMFGDGVYEVIPVYSGKLFRSEGHLARLQYSLDAIDIPNPLTTLQWIEIFSTLIEHNFPSVDSVIYLQITRGTMEKRDHAWPPDMQPNVLVTCTEQVYAKQDSATAGAKAVTLDDTRWSDCHIKTINLLANALLHQEARNQGANEAILIREGFAIEGSQSNLFIVRDDIVITPPKSRHMLGGITREIVLELCQQNKIICSEKNISEDDLHQANEIWLSSATREILPIVTLNQHAVGNGRPGVVWQQIIQLYHEYKFNLIRSPGD
ncbi:D-alanine aminotransferase [bacterium MnTg03]|nr:D-alanine aminotransferase [bacterium MnTg03]